MRNLIKNLKSPELVVQIQEFFGVEYVSGGKRRKNSTEVKHQQQNGGSVNKKFIDNSNNVNKNDEGYIINNKFWYYLFIIGTELGDEIFYASFIPFWFWNIDSAVGRRVIFLWSIVMYIGQSFKDIIRWPRPGSPVIRLQKKWGLEYGMPSTHAMVAVSIPFSVLIFTMQRYQYPVIVGLIAATIWCSVICLSRLYLGMHSVLDVVVGILLTIFLMFFLIPLVDYLDYHILTNPYSPIAVLFVSIMLIVCYPKSDKWTPTRGDTTMTISVCVGLQLGAWVNYQIGDLVPTNLPPPYEIIWPNYQMIGLLLLRTVLGLCCIVATRAIAKFISYALVCAILGRDRKEIRNSENSLENKHKTIVDLCYKYFTYGMIGFNTQYLLPNAFKLVGLGRPDFYTEI